MANLHLNEGTIVVAQARPLLIEKHSGRACVVGRDVMRNAQRRSLTVSQHLIRHTMKPTDGTTQRRQDHEPPPVIAQRGWRFHHLGIPTAIPKPNEVHLPHLKIHVSGFDTSPYGIEWIRFDADYVVSDLIRTVPHVAFEVDDLDAALVGKILLGEIGSPSPGVRVAMIVDDGAPIELLEFSKVGGQAERL